MIAIAKRPTAYALLPGAGVAEAQPLGVEKLALEAEDVLFAAIDRIADDGAFEPGQVDPNLVGPAGFRASCTAQNLQAPGSGCGSVCRGGFPRPAQRRRGSRRC
ncbi:MAG: hypothetical protein HC875_05385 [Anaerolineales bacterium]|nr:hypothetical protein [Anaerolineales bacterium]